MRRSFRFHLLGVLFYALVAFIVLHPLIFHNGTHAAGFDYFNYHWNQWWIRHVLTTPGLELFYSDYVLFPKMNNLGYHALTAFWFPVWALVEPLAGTFTAMNAIIFMACFLNGYTLFLLLLREGAAPGLALIGGLALQISPVTRYFYHNTHINLMDWFWLPAHLLMWQQVAAAVESGRWRRAAGWSAVQGIGLWGVGLTDLQFPIFVGFLLVPYGFYTLAKAQKRVQLVLAGLLIITVALALLWFAGPLKAMRAFSGTLAPGTVEDRPGIPFPGGYLSTYEVWWNWNTPTLGGFVMAATFVALAVGLSRQRRKLPGERWLWLGLLLPPLIFSMGPNITVLGLTIPMPFRLLHSVTNGMFRMPWRLAPIFVTAAVVFTAKTLTPLLARLGAQRSLGVLAAAVFVLGLDVRVFETGPLQPVLYPYRFYEMMGQERGAPYDNYVVIEAPTGAGTGETLIGQERAIQYQMYGMTHGKRMVNGFISRAPVENFWYLRTDDPLLSWLGQRRPLEPELVGSQLRRIIPEWPVGYIVVHQDDVGRTSSTPQEIIGYFNSLPDLLCPLWIERDAVVYRTTWHPDGCPARTPPEISAGSFEIDIGSPGDERFTGWGWHWPEAVAGLTLRWAGEYSQTRLYIDLPPSAYDVTLSVQAFWESRRLRLLVNDMPLGEGQPVAVAGLQTLSFALPSALVGNGKHLTITLDYDGVVVPNEVGQSADPRKLAVAIDWIRFTRQESS